MRRSPRPVALAASALLAAAVLLLPWYQLGAYEPNGWDASFWLRAAVVLAALNLIAVRADGRGAGSVAVATAAALLVGIRVALPPDFGFDFDGLEVPVERRWGAWVGLGAALLAMAVAVAGRPRDALHAHPGGW